MTTYSRRNFMIRQVAGMSGIACGVMGQGSNILAAPTKPLLQRREFDLKPRIPPLRPQATAMISMFMQGGPSQMDLCDPKP